MYRIYLILCILTTFLLANGQEGPYDYIWPQYVCRDQRVAQSLSEILGILPGDIGGNHQPLVLKFFQSNTDPVPESYLLRISRMNTSRPVDISGYLEIRSFICLLEGNPPAALFSLSPDKCACQSVLATGFNTEDNAQRTDEFLVILSAKDSKYECVARVYR